jgi:hypothetical protein
VLVSCYLHRLELHQIILSNQIKISSANQKTVNQSCGGAFPIGKLEPCSSVQQEVNADLLCIEAPNDNKVNTLSFVTTDLSDFSSTKPNS